MQLCCSLRGTRRHALLAPCLRHAPSPPAHPPVRLLVSSRLKTTKLMSVTEDTRAGHVILFRTLLSCSCSLYFAGLLAVDTNNLG